jgi:hypothetical protein
MREPPRFLPMASMSPDLNLRAAIPIKKGVAAIISAGLLNPTLRDISNAFENRLSAFQGPGLNVHRSLLRRLAEADEDSEALEPPPCRFSIITSWR